MKLKVFFITLLTLILLAMPIAAQAPQEITLTVSSDGPTKEDATKNALRNAIEQAYGTFVSANTTILNDELVKDEIVTVSNGSIKEYKEISAVQTNNGSFFVTLMATVSLPNLITYAKSHGSECEFAGNTFGMEMKLFELQKENELKALYNLTDQIEAIIPSVLKYKLTVKEPRVAQKFNITWRWTDYYTDEAALKAGRMYNTDYVIYLKFNRNRKKDSNRSSEYEVATVDAKAKELRQKFSEANIDATMNNYYEVPMRISWQEASYPGIYHILHKTLTSIALPDPEAYKAKGIAPTTVLAFTSKPYLYFRNSFEEISNWAQDLFSRIQRQFNNFVITDNTGVKSDFFPQFQVDRCREYYKLLREGLYIGPNMVNDTVPLMMNDPCCDICFFGTGLFKDFFRFSNPHYESDYCPEVDKSHNIIKFPRISYITQSNRDEYNEFYWEINVYIPKEDIGKYSKFWIEPKK